MFDSLLSMIATLFVLLAVGFVAGKCNIIDGIASKRLSALILKVAQPALIIESLIGMDYTRENLLLGLEALALGFGLSHRPGEYACRGDGQQRHVLLLRVRDPRIVPATQ